MPRIRLSQTQLRTAGSPDVRVGRGWNEGLSAIERAAHATIQSTRYQQRTVDRAIQTFNRSLHEVDGMMRDINYMAELDARNVKAEWDKAMLDGIEGSVGEDGNTHGGIVRKTWQDYEHGKTSPITDLGEIEKNFQESESYKGMNSIVRRKFDRMVSADRARYLSMANRMYDRNEIERKKFLDERADANGDRKIETVIAAKDENGNIDDAAFEAVAREETMKKVGRRMTRFMENPEILDDPTATPESIKWKDDKFAEAFWNAQRDELRKVSIGRCEKLAENAGFGNPQWIEGKLVTNDEQLAAAERYMEELANPKALPDGTKLPARITPEEAKALGYKCLQARSQLDHRVAQTLAAESANALAKGDLASLEAAEKKFALTAESFKGNQQRETAALIAKNKVSEAADKKVTADLWDRLVNGERLTVNMTTNDGSTVETPIFEPGTRQANILPALQEEFNRQKNAIEDKATKELHGRNEASLRVNMLMAAKTNPGEFYATLAEYSKTNGISLKQYSDIKNEFHGVWLKEGMPEKAAAMVQTFKNTFFADADFDLNSLYQFNKSTNAIELNKPNDFDTDGLKVAYEAKPGTQTLEPSEQLYLLNWATRLAEMDGETVSVDPESGERLDKPVKINAAEYFQRLCTRMKFGKEVSSKEKTIASRLDAMITLRAGIAERDAAAGAENAKRQRPSAPMTVKMPTRLGTQVRTEQE